MIKNHEIISKSNKKMVERFTLSPLLSWNQCLSLCAIKMNSVDGKKPKEDREDKNVETGDLATKGDGTCVADNLTR